jgi:hypothetical protein
MSFASSLVPRHRARRLGWSGPGRFVGLASSMLLGLLSGCTLHHSKQALSADAATGEPPPADARFVTEEDSGISILGMFVLAEPDHYAVLLERMRRDHRCARLLYPQLDFYTDYWLLVAFPISRITSLCEPETTGGPAPAAPIPPLGAGPGAPRESAPAPATPSPSPYDPPATPAPAPSPSPAP